MQVNPKLEVCDAMVFTMPDRLYRGYVFDLDGTVYLGDELLSGAVPLIKTLRRAGCLSLIHI